MNEFDTSFIGPIVIFAIVMFLISALYFLAQALLLLAIPIAILYAIKECVVYIIRRRKKRKIAKQGEEYLNWYNGDKLMPPPYFKQTSSRFLK